jgi:hypothetical protein
MSRISVENEQIVNAEPEKVYAILSDYKNERPRLLTPNFLDYKVEQGGQGAGTVVSYRLHAANRERPYKIRVSAAQPNSLLVEQDENSSLVTKWSLSPFHAGQRTKVLVSTTWEGGTGVGGFFERTFAPLGVRNIYNAILAKLSNTLAPDEEVTAVQGNEGSPISNFSGLFLVFLVVVGLALGIAYLQRRQSNQ